MAFEQIKNLYGKIMSNYYKNRFNHHLDKFQLYSQKTLESIGYDIETFDESKTRKFSKKAFMHGSLVFGLTKKITVPVEIMDQFHEVYAQIGTIWTIQNTAERYDKMMRELKEFAEIRTQEFDSDSSGLNLFSPDCEGSDPESLGED